MLEKAEEDSKELPKKTDEDSKVLSFRDVKQRVDYSRMWVYNHFIQAGGKNDIYLQSILDCFLAVAQYPLTFAFYENDADFPGGKRLLFHFLNDKKHYQKYTNLLLHENLKESAFPFFPELFDQKYNLLILHMHTKNEYAPGEGEYTILKDVVPSFKKRSLGEGGVQGLSTYLNLCAYFFFIAPWLSFETSFKEQMELGLKESIIKLAEAHKSTEGGSQSYAKTAGSAWAQQSLPSNYYPPSFTEDSFKESLQKYPLPNEIDNWHKHLRRVFDQTLLDTSYGMDVQHHMTFRNRSFEEANREQPNYINFRIPNYLLAYRSFSREADDLRHVVQDDKKSDQGYGYDSRFLISDSKHSPIRDLLYNLRKRFIKHGRAQDAIGGEQYLYRKIDKNDETLSISQEVYKKILQDIDERFWNILQSKDGVQKLINILQTSVGPNARSMCDPCFASGLIHTNRLFINGALDRVSLNVVKKLEDVDGYIEENHYDLLRIAALYYIFLHMIDLPKEYNASSLMAILMPVVVEGGGTWGCSIHITYIDDYETQFASGASWVSLHLLMTVIKDKYQRLIYQTLWEGFQRRISNLLTRFLFHSDEYEVALLLENFNKLMRSEQRLVPFSVPSILLDLKEKERCRHKIVVKNFNSEIDYELKWQMLSNPFFLPMQPLAEKQIPSVYSAIRDGLNEAYFGKKK